MFLVISASPQISDVRPDMRQRTLFVTSRVACCRNRMLLARENVDSPRAAMGWKSFKVCSNGPRSQKKRATVTRPDLHTWWMASGRSPCPVLGGNNNCRSWNFHFQLCYEHFVPATRGITRDEQCSLPHVRSTVWHLRRNLLFHLSI